MKHKLARFLPSWLTGKVLIGMFLLMLIVHLVIFVLYSQRNSSAEFQVNRDIIARQVINFIQTVENTPPDKQQQMVNALDLPNFKVTIDKKPKNELTFNNASLWEILEKISEQKPNISLSFWLTNNRWLNINAAIVQTSLAYQEFLLVLEILVTGMFIFVLWTVNRFTVPLKDFTSAAERLGVDLHTDPLPIYGPAVVRTTANAMNKMQQRIRDLVQARTQMLAAISHDLRTPITRLKLRAQYIEDETQSQKFIHDLDQMEAMISETLAFAREDSQSEKKIKIDLASLLSTLCEEFAETHRPVSFQTTITRLPVVGAPIGLRRVFNNLIENALKYAGTAEVSLHANKEDAIITVDDRGPGIPAKQMTQMFMPFVRGEHSRSRETGGTGLGLAVAQDIIRAHGGAIKLMARDGGGLRVWVRLPKAK